MMIFNSWFKKELPAADNAVKDDNRERLGKAHKNQAIAERDHDEAIEVLEELELQNDLNHYAALVESALSHRRATFEERRVDASPRRTKDNKD